ncbi:hypothetical protein ACQEVF_24080 [Nonomuraea polychroma]|uniref:hypothetical protein n=1 Tax=Nonomuraea polychroma TaxID=46176 RepID=UPI003D8BAD90
MTRSVLARSTGGSNQAELLGSLAEAARFAAWLHADMADAGTARTYYRVAIDATRRAEHGLLTAYMTRSLAQFELDEDPLLGLRLLARARTVMGDRPPPAARAWLACVEAFAEVSYVLTSTLPGAPSSTRHFGP